MNPRKLLYLTGIIILVVAMADMALTNQAADWTMNPRPAPRPVAVPAPIQAAPQTTPAPQQAPAAKTFIVPEPVPTPEMVTDTAVRHSTNSVTGFILPAALLLLSLGALAAWGKWHWAALEKQLAPKRLIGQGTAVLLCLFLLGCQTPEADPLPPDEYLDHALNWLEANAVMATTVDWEAVRGEAVAMVGEAQMTADTYPAIVYAIEQLNDPQAFMTTPERGMFEGTGLGIIAVHPQNIVIEVTPGSPAAAAGIQVGDEVLTINENLPTPQDARPREIDFLHDALVLQTFTLTLRRGETQWETTLTEGSYDFESQPVSRVFSVGEQTAAYLDMSTDWGTRPYPTDAQAAMAEVDSTSTCGWIIDLRHTRGGDLWTYFAALSPILGEGELGGFVYNDGSEEMWRFEDGKVFWADEEREESYVRGRRYELERPSPPVALLISPLTEAAGELVVVAFQGWGTVRSFGETTLGSPHLILHTPLSDGARLFVSGARGMDRNGNVYGGPINPDEPVSIAWQHLGDENDPVISAALDWLATQPTCTP